jgi:tetratricopeptide (TPR) repeat protein
MRFLNSFLSWIFSQPEYHPSVNGFPAKYHRVSQLQLLLRRPIVVPLSVCVLLVCVTVGVYWPVQKYDYVVLDDPVFVYQNPYVLHGLTWSGVKWAFQFGHGDYWHPLTWLSLMLDVTVFGQGAGGLHSTNVLLHAFNVALVFLLLRSWTGALGRSAMVAVLFALHPLRVESVAWITERKDVLSGLFFLLTLWAYGNYARRETVAKSRAPTFRRSALHYGLALLFYACALMSKTMVVTLPCVLLLLDVWPWRRFKLAGIGSQIGMRRMVCELIPFLVLSGISLWTTTRSQPTETPIFVLSDLNWKLRIETVFVTYAQYLGKTFWPVRLATYYPHPWHWSGSLVVSSIVLVFGCSAVVLRFRRDRPYLFVGWFWFVGMLVPVLGLTHGWFQYLADRFTYLPSIGLLILLVWAIFEWAGYGRARRLTMAIVLGLGVVTCALRTRDQLNYWRNSELLLNHALAIGEKSDLSYQKLAEYFLDHGRATEAIGTYREALNLFTNSASIKSSPFSATSGKSPSYYEAWSHVTFGYFLETAGQSAEAIEELNKGISLLPDIPKAYNVRGSAHADRGEIEDAVKDYREALRINPNYVEAHNNLGLALVGEGKISEALAQYAEALRVEPNATVYVNRGNAFAAEGRMSDAIDCYEKGLQLDPGIAKAHYNLGAALAHAGKMDEAIAHFTEADRLEPGHAEIYNNLGYALVVKGRLEEGMSNYRRAIQINPNYSDAYANLAWAFMAKGRLDEAIQQFNQALRIDPNSVDIHNALGTALERNGLMSQATHEYEQAARLDPNNPAFHLNLGRVLLRLNQTNEAKVQLSEALRLKPDFTEARQLLHSVGADLAR